MSFHSLVSSAKRYSPDFRQLPPGHRTCMFIYKPSQLPGSIQLGCYFRRTETNQTHRNLPCPTMQVGYPLTPGSRLESVHVWVKSLARNSTPLQATTAPRRPKRFVLFLGKENTQNNNICVYGSYEYRRWPLSVVSAA